MLGVDFVINALFDTSGFRPEGDCAPTIVRAIAVNPAANIDKLVRRMRPTVISNTGSERVKQTRYREGSFAAVGDVLTGQVAR